MGSSSGQFTYVVDPKNGMATITGYIRFKDPMNPTSDRFPMNIAIPNMIDSYPVRSIGAYAFQHCRLGKVIIPIGVIIGAHAFTSSDIQSVIFEPPSIFQGIDRYSGIDEYAFCNCINLTEVYIPDMEMVHRFYGIGGHAFSGCTELTHVRIGSGVTNIGNEAFLNCKGLTRIIIPDSVTSIRIGAFAGCTGLTGTLTIGSGVTSIGKDAFSGCAGLTGVTIGSGVTTIGYHAFAGCTGLTEFDVVNGNATYSSKDGVLYDISQNVLICYPSGKSGPFTLPDSVSRIGNDAFAGCIVLTGVNIGSSVTTIGSSAFIGCTGLTGATIGSGVTTIFSSAFSGCTGLRTINALPVNPPVTNKGVFSGVPSTAVLHIRTGANGYIGVEPWKQFEIINDL